MASEDSDDGHPSGWKENPKIVIIGAGIAGLTAGKYLINHGFSNLDIVEATDRTGGRIWSIDLGELSLYFCRGEWCRSDSSELWMLSLNW